MNLKIDPKGLPAEGLHIEGRLAPAVFGFKPEDDVRALSPLEYELDISRDEDDLIVLGRMVATFDLECGRCAERFQLRMELSHYVLDIPLENGELIDLTTWLREDMILALPTHPRCETANVTPRRCPAEGKFEPPTEVGGNEPQTEDRDMWKALDQLDNLKRN
jgi:uncharacterized protein